MDRFGGTGSMNCARPVLAPLVEKSGRAEQGSVLMRVANPNGQDGVLTDGYDYQ